MDPGRQFLVARAFREAEGRFGGKEGGREFLRQSTPGWLRRFLVPGNLLGITSTNGAGIWNLIGLKEHSACLKLADAFFPLKLSEDFQHLDPPRQTANPKVAIVSAVLLRRPEIYVRSSLFLPGQNFAHTV